MPGGEPSPRETDTNTFELGPDEIHRRVATAMEGFELPNGWTVSVGWRKNPNRGFSSQFTGREARLFTPTDERLLGPIAADENGIFRDVVGATVAHVANFIRRALHDASAPAGKMTPEFRAARKAFIEQLLDLGDPTDNPNLLIERAETFLNRSSDTPVDIWVVLDVIESLLGLAKRLQNPSTPEA